MIKLRVVFISPHSDPLAELGTPDSGGQCVYEKELARHLSFLDDVDEVIVFTRWHRGKNLFDLINTKAKVLRIPAGPEGFVRKEKLFPYLDEFSERLIERLEDNPPDVIHSHYWDGGVVGLKIQEYLKIPHIFTFHSVGKLKANVIRSDYRERIENEERIVKNVDLIVALTEIEKKDISRLYNVPLDKIVVVPAGTEEFEVPNEDDIKFHRNKFLKDADYLLVSLGRIDRRKGFRELVKAVRILKNIAEKHNKKVKLIISGGRDDEEDTEEKREKENLKNLIDHLGLSDTVEIISRFERSFLPIFLSIGDVLVIPSLYEPFGLVVVEGLSVGAIIAGTVHGGPMEIIKDGWNGFLIDPLNEEKMAEKIWKILTLPESEKNRIKKNARESAKRYYWRNIATRIFEVYKDLVG